MQGILNRSIKDSITVFISTSYVLMKHNVTLYNKMEEVHSRMRRAYDQMKRAHNRMKRAQNRMKKAHNRMK